MRVHKGIWWAMAINENEWAIFPPDKTRSEIRDEMPLDCGHWRVAELAACIGQGEKYKRIILKALNRGRE